MGDDSLRDNSALQTINLPQLTTIGDGSLGYNSADFIVTKTPTTWEGIAHTTNNLQQKIEEAIYSNLIENLEEIGFKLKDDISLEELQKIFTKELINYLQFGKIEESELTTPPPCI
jgi:tRNA A58 N-methylase Trm61